MHSILQTYDNVHVLLIQEPWFYTVATVRSNMNPEGMP